MATTSLWHIEGRLKDLIDYVENPEKTKAKTPELQDLYNVFSYAQRPEATQKGEYVTALNCLKETALRQMILTKKRYGKTGGYIAWHGYQSFKPEEATPQLAHEISVKLAKEMWGNRFEIIVTTHLDKEHIHCRFCFNSVSFRDGGKYNYSQAERKRMIEISDHLCREYGLSVIETLDDLYADRKKIQWDMDALIARRTKLQNRIRRATPAEKETLRQEKAGVTEQITALRKQLKLNKGIETRSAQIQEKTDLYFANEIRAKEVQQQKKQQRRERDTR